MHATLLSHADKSCQSYSAQKPEINWDKTRKTRYSHPRSLLLINMMNKTLKMLVKVSVFQIHQSLRNICTVLESASGMGFHQRKFQMLEIEDGLEPTIFLGNEEVAAVKAWLSVLLEDHLHSSLCKQTLHFSYENIRIVVLYQNLNNTYGSLSKLEQITSFCGLQSPTWHAWYGFPSLYLGGKWSESIEWQIATWVWEADIHCVALFSMCRAA